MRWHVISAVFSRNVKQYFSGVLGYLFIVVFVMVCAMLTFSQQFFADNLSNLDQLSKAFPALLLVFIPAITMNVWAEEKRQGTDAILFTLPASDMEIMLGKYLAVSAVYTIALIFSMTQLIALKVIGQPDWGVIGSTYVGYWLSGLSLVAIGMFASSLTSVVPVAFVLGALFCSVPVFIGNFFANAPKAIEGLLPESMSNFADGFIGMEQFAIDWNLQEFTLGLIPLSNMVYFVSIIAFMLYLNLVVISHRHWSRGQQVSLGGQFAIRIISLAVALIAFNYIVNQTSSSLLTRMDLTAEKLYTLDSATIKTLKKAREDDQLVTVQAFVSRDIPRSFVSTKKQFLGLLRQFQYYGGKNVDVRFEDVLPSSDEEIEAKQLGLEGRKDRSEVGGRVVEQEVFMGARISSSQDDAILPFVENDSSIEYQLTHAIATTTDKDRKLTLGVLETDTFFTGPDLDGLRIPWTYSQTLAQLDAQYKVKTIAQDDLAKYVDGDPPAPASEESVDEKPEKKKAPDVLLVADPSSLTSAATDNLVKYMQTGNPVILMADPLPFIWTSRAPSYFGVIGAPNQNRVAQRSPYAQYFASSFEPKADAGRCTRILSALGIEWDSSRVAWNLNDPHPNFKGTWLNRGQQPIWPPDFGPYESAFVFITNLGDHVAFEAENPISTGLKEVLFFYPGSIRQATGSQKKFEPLITMEAESGTTAWNELTTNRVVFNRMTRQQQNQPNEFTGEDLVVLNPEPARFIDSNEHVVAAQITGDGVNAVFIADLDFVSDLYADQISERGLDKELDNVAFLQNAIEVLAGDEAFVQLRNRRPAPRTLSYIEQETNQFRVKRARAQEEIENDIRDQLKEEQSKLDEQTAKIGEDTDLSFFEKLQKTSQEASDAQRRFDLKKEKLDRDLKIKIEKLQSVEQNNIRRTEGWVKMLAVGFAPLPAFLLGCLVYVFRKTNERSQVKASRRV